MSIPIPPEVTAIRIISDADVANEPSFKEKANEINQFLNNCDFAVLTAINLTSLC
ncbi:MAG: hypothetical protein R2852_09340 [Bacteroidia bacterium]